MTSQPLAPWWTLAHHSRPFAQQGLLGVCNAETLPGQWQSGCLLWLPFQHIALHCPQGSHISSEPQQKFPDPPALLTKSILCPCGHDDDFCPGLCNLDLNSRVPIFSHLLSEKLVQFSFEDAIFFKDKLSLLGNLHCHLASHTLERQECYGFLIDPVIILEYPFWCLIPLIWIIVSSFYGLLIDVFKLYLVK